MEHIHDLTVSTNKDLAAVQNIHSTLDKSKRHRNFMFFGGGAKTLDGIVRQGKRRMAILLILPAQAVKALQNRFAEQDQIGFSTARSHGIHDSLQIEINIEILYQCRG